MEQNGSRLRATVVLTCSIAASGARELKVRSKAHKAVYNHTLATILVEYASAVIYMSDLTELFSWTCHRCDGKTKGFEVIKLIVDLQHCLQAHVGVAKDLNAMVIAFRGSQEHRIQNWVEDLYWKQVDISYPGIFVAMVSSSWIYYAYHNMTMQLGTMDAVKRAKDLYGDINIMVTGHSIDGLWHPFGDLIFCFFQTSTRLIYLTFGQPHIGNAMFVSYYSIPITNGNDIVPHLPLYYSRFPQKTYHHFPRVVRLYDIGFGSPVNEVEKVCDGSGEDPMCSRNTYGRLIKVCFCILVTGNSITDHLLYYGVELMAETGGSCKIVMDSRLKEYGNEDKGNLMLLRNPSASALRLR
ncbi:hypothetical protein ACJRO7_032321 [Eucalyptus globulus]|uniref:Fungal lipase-type domain-containing protein n=1 Tax=Eucalyptus globulus TaxID=34317 RepID=A0ABD3JJ57_EUCGL